MISNSAIIKLITFINKFSTLEQNDLVYLQEIFKFTVIKKNQIFLKAGNQLKYLGFIIKGTFRYFYIDINGNERTKYFVIENNFVFSLSSYIEKTPSLFYIEALEDSDLLVVPIEIINKLINSNIIWQNIYRNILETTYLIKEKREAEFLLFDAKYRYLHFLKEYPGLDKIVKQHYIASFLGIEPESLSRIRSQLIIS